MRSETTMSLIMRVNLIVKYLIVTMRFFAMGSVLIMRLIVGPVRSMSRRRRKASAYGRERSQKDEQSELGDW